MSSKVPPEGHWTFNRIFSVTFHKITVLHLSLLFYLFCSIIVWMSCVHTVWEWGCDVLRQPLTLCTWSVCSCIVIFLPLLPAAPSKSVRASLWCSSCASTAGRIRSIEKYINLFGNQTYDLPASSIVPELTTLPHISTNVATIRNSSNLWHMWMKSTVMCHALIFSPWTEIHLIKDIVLKCSQSKLNVIKVKYLGNHYPSKYGLYFSLVSWNEEFCVSETSDPEARFRT